MVLNPHSTASEKQHYSQLLERWSRLNVCPLEDADFRPVSVSTLRRRMVIFGDSSDDDDEEEADNRVASPSKLQLNSRRSASSNNSLPRTIFHRALEASHLDWDDSHLKYILEHDGPHFSNEPHSSSDFNSHGYPLWKGNNCIIRRNLFY